MGSSILSALVWLVCLIWRPASVWGFVACYILANIGMGYIFQHFGWDGGFIALIGACVLSIGFSASTWNREKQYIA